MFSYLDELFAGCDGYQISKTEKSRLREQGLTFFFFFFFFHLVDFHCYFPFPSFFFLFFFFHFNLMIRCSNVN